MIPASSITAVLTADLSYNPNIHVQTVEIDRTGTNLIAEATTNFVRWYLSKTDFTNMLRIVSGETDVSNQIFTMDASQGRLISDASAAVVKLSNVSNSFTIPLYDPSVKYGIDASLNEADYIGYVGDISVNYDRKLFASDASNTVTSSSTITTWSFAASSISLTINWQATDMSNAIVVTANAGSTLTVNKAYNDAAADFIQIKMDGDEFDAHGRTNSSADITSASIDYASKFASHTGGSIAFEADTPTLTISDLTLTKALQQGINRDGITRDISNTDSLRTVVKEMIELRELVGFQSASTITGMFKTTVAGQYSSSNDISFTLTPMIYFRYREPTRFAVGDTDPYGLSNTVTQTTHLYALGIDASGDLDNIDNIDDGTLTAKLQLYDGTDISASSYEIMSMKHSLFENPNNDEYSNTSYNTYLYKLNFPEVTGKSPFYLYNDTGTARNNDLASVTINGISLKVGREKTNLTESFPSTDISFVYLITQALSESITITPIAAVTAEVAMSTQTSTRGILSFTGGYDLRLTDQYTGATTGVHKVCLYKTTGTTESLVTNAIGTTTVSANELVRYTFVNDESSGSFDVWVDGVKQWNSSSTDVTNISDLGNIDKLGTTYLDTPSMRVSGTLQDLKVFTEVITTTQIEEGDMPKAEVSWSMKTTIPEVGTIALASGASLDSLSFKKSKPVAAKVPTLLSHGALSDYDYTVGGSTLTRSYTFDRPLGNFTFDVTFTSTDGNHTGTATFQKTGANGTISFPINNSTGYTINGLQMRNLGSGSTTDVDDATYGFTIASSQLWTPPTGVTSFTSHSSLPGSFMLVKDNQVTLRFTLTGTGDLHSSVNGTIVDRLQVTVGSTTSALDPDAASTSMVVNAVNRTLQFTYTATSVAQHDFLLYLKKPDGTRYTTTAYTASVSVTDVYEFPTMSSVTKDIDVVTVGETLTCTSQFDSGVSDVTGVASITPTGYGAITATNVSISGTTYVYSFPVDYDVTYSGAITLTLGSSSITQSYSWATATTPFTLTGNHIYTFPSSFTHSGTLKEQEANTATLTFIGGDLLHSSVVATQIEYVKWNQGSDVTVSSSDLTCSDPLETITIANLTPTSGTTDLVFKVKLKAPDGTVSTEITHTVAANSISVLQTGYANSYFTLGSSEMTFNGSNHFTGFSTSRGNMTITGSSVLTKDTVNSNNIMKFTSTSNDTSTASAFQVSTNTITNFTFKTYVQVYKIGPNTPSGTELFRASPTMIGPRTGNINGYNTGVYSDTIWNTYTTSSVTYPLDKLYVYSERLNGSVKTSLSRSTGISNSNHLSSASATATGDQLLYIQFYQSNSDLNFNEYFPYPGLNHEELFIQNYINTRQIVQDTEVYETAFFQTNITQAEREAYVQYISNKYNTFLVQKSRWLTYQGYGSMPSNQRSHFFEFFGNGFTSTNLMWNYAAGGSYLNYGGVNLYNSGHYLVWRQTTSQEYQTLNYHLTYTGLRGAVVSLYGRNYINAAEVNTKPTGSGDGWTLVATDIDMIGKYDSTTLGNYSTAGTKVSTDSFSVWAIVWTSNSSSHGPLFTRIAVNDSITTGWVNDTETSVIS